MKFYFKRWPIKSNLKRSASLTWSAHIKLGKHSCSTSLNLRFTMSNNMFPLQVIIKVILAVTAAATPQYSGLNTGQLSILRNNPNIYSRLPIESGYYSHGLIPSNRILRQKGRMTRSTPHQHECANKYYHPRSHIGDLASCPFSFVVNEDPDRVPRKLVEMVCKKTCNSCGHGRHCTQLKMKAETYYPSTGEVVPTEVSIGCVCLPIELGRRAHILDLNDVIIH